MALLRNRFIVLFYLLCAGGFTQIPEFAQQYRQRLGGAIDEIRRDLDQFDAEARNYGLSRGEAIARFKINSDSLIAGRGQGVEKKVQRLEMLEKSRLALSAGDTFQKYYSLIRDGDLQVGSATLDEFAPAVPTSRESAVFGVIGFFVGEVLRLIFGAFLALLTVRWRRA